MMKLISGSRSSAVCTSLCIFEPQSGAGTFTSVILQSGHWLANSSAMASAIGFEGGDSLVVMTSVFAAPSGLHDREVGHQPGRVDERREPERGHVVGQRHRRVVLVRHDDGDVGVGQLLQLRLEELRRRGEDDEIGILGDGLLDALHPLGRLAGGGPDGEVDADLLRRSPRSAFCTATTNGMLLVFGMKNTDLPSAALASNAGP